MERKARTRFAEKRILVIDDDTDITESLDMILTDHGFSHVRTLNSGAEAIEVMKLGSGLADSSAEPPPYDAILLDIMLPKTNGFELCRRIRDQWGKAPVILLISGYEITDKAPRYIDSGADDFLSKPLVPEDLLHRLDVQLVRHSQCDSLLRAEHSMEKISDCSLDQIGRYSIKRVLSWSGGLVVYEAEFSGKAYLLKILTQQAMECDSIRDRFEREQEIMAALRHPNIVTLVDSGKYHGLGYFVTEYISGNTLEMYSRSDPNPTLRVAKDIAIQMADALGYMHKHHVIHRDIKMSNIFLERAPLQVKIGDFGISFAEDCPRLTQPGYSLGTPAYMAPEQFSGGTLSPAMDIYSFGATLYHLSTGLPPYSASNAVEFMQKHLNARPPRITHSRPDYPKEWDEFIIDQCMAVDPQKRPATMTVVMDVLKSIDAG